MEGFDDACCVILLLLLPERVVIAILPIALLSFEKEMIPTNPLTQTSIVLIRTTLRLSR
jgi:hypothetical protein